MRIRTFVASAILIAAATTGAFADFNRWSSEVEKDPFSGGEKTSVDYSTSTRSGVSMYCDTAESGIEVRIAPGYVYTADMQQLKPVMEFAIDGTKLQFVPAPANVISVGDNLAAASLFLNKEQSITLVKAFADAKSQIAIKDGMSDRPHLLRASGSTKTGQAIVRCVEKQK